MENKLAKDITKFFNDPYKFVMYIFPWGEKGTQLEHHDGPDKWQTNLLNKIKEEIEKNDGDVNNAIKIAIASGHGVGKSAMTAWLILWYISTHPHPQIVITANTQSQLTSKTWRELALWHKRAIHSDWFEWTATKFYLKEHPETWFASAIPWSENKSEAFAGTHAENVMIIFDEASGIVPSIWEVTQGAMTTPSAMWFVFGNPTKNTGGFRECFGKFKHRWTTFKVDSRDAKMADKNEINQWVEDYGEDSDFVRIRVRGEFPVSSSLQFISNDIVDKAMKNEAANYQSMPFIMGVDVARFGSDQSVICIRQGRKIHVLLKYRELNTTQLSQQISNIAKDYRGITVFIDGVGVGGGVVDQCNNYGMHSIMEVNAGSKAENTERYRNKRAEMWDRMLEWLKAGADIPKDDELMQDLISIEYGYSVTNQLQLEKKDDMKRRGLNSPDCGDALAHTFAEHIWKANKSYNKPIQMNTGWDAFK